MVRYIEKRAASTLLTIFLVSVLVFVLIHLVPGDPAKVILGLRGTPYAVAELRHSLGLDRPFLAQYAAFWSGVFHGTMGLSVVYRVPVLGLIMGRLPATLFLIVYSALISVVIGIPIGTLAALNRERPFDHVARILLLIGVAVPTFWIGTLFVLFFSLRLGWFPAAGYGSDFVEHLHSLFLPALTLAIWQITLIARDLRSTVIDVLQLPYVEFARLKGLRPRTVLIGHVLRTSLTSTVTILAINVSFLLAGAVVVETVFSVPGSGSLLIQAVFGRDYPLVQGVTFVYAVLVILINLVTDLIYPILDPRVRLQ